MVRAIVRQSPTRAAPPSLSAVCRDLMLDAASSAQLESLLAQSGDGRDNLLGRLKAVIAHGAPYEAQYAALSTTKPEMVTEEKAWLAGLIRAALAAERGHWAALYLSLNYRELLCRRIDHRLNPRSVVRMPSAFVYAMQ